MDFEKINADDTLNQGRIKINNNYDAVGNQVSELKSDLKQSESRLSESIVEIADDVFIKKYASIGRTNSILTLYPIGGYINNDTGAFMRSSNYTCYYFTMPHSCEVWFDTKDTWGQIAVYDGEVFDDSKLIKIGSLSRNTLPYETNKMSVQKGKTVAICMSNFSKEFVFHFLKDIIFVDKMELKKVSSTEFKVSVPNVTKNNKVIYYFVKYNKTWDSLDYIDASGQTKQAQNVISANNWNNLYVYDGFGNVIAQGHSNFITQTLDANIHCGNGHGNEVNTFVNFFVDGNKIDIDNMENGEIVYGSDFRMIQRSDIYKAGGSTNSSVNDVNVNYPYLDTSGNPIVNFKHRLEMHISENNEIEINNKLIVMRDNISFKQCHGAMLQCDYGKFTNVVCNNAEETMNWIDASGNCSPSLDSTINLKVNVSQKCDRVEMFGKNFYIRQEMRQDDVTKKNKSRVYFNYYTNRLKAYFQPVVTNFGKFDGETLDVFNIGDVISVTDYRKIELT